MKKEIHLFIIWQNAYVETHRIIDDIKKRFGFCDIYEIHWSRERFSENLSRLYGQKLPPNSSKELHCGIGPFTLIVVSDSNPNYGMRKSSSGPMSVNTNIFDAKSRYRQWTGGGHKIHATNTFEEVNHDLVLLLGLNIKDYLHKQKDKRWNGKTTIIKKDLSGSQGWNGLGELFYVLNSTVDYVVLRNFERLPEKYRLESHGDIDLLVSDYKETLWITNSKPLFKENYRVHNQVRIIGQDVAFDFRFFGDNYYDEPWERKILKDRVLEKNAFFRPNDEDYFYSLLYHALVHKPKIKDDYIEKLISLADRAKIENFYPKMFSDMKALKSFLDNYLQSVGFNYTRPNDFSVYYKELRTCPLPFIMPPETVISSRCLTEKDGTEYWSRVYDGGDAIYKQATSDLAQREALFLSQFSKAYFARVLDTSYRSGYSVIKLEKIHGLPLDDVKAETCSSSAILFTFIQHCLTLLDEFMSKGIVHRDIRRDNILVRDGKPVLIDFGWAISDTHPYFTPSHLGDTERPPDGSFCDIYSMGKVLEQVNGHRYPAFDLVIELMTETDASLRITDLAILRTLFNVVAESAGSYAREKQEETKALGDSKDVDNDTDLYRSAINQLLGQIFKRNRLLKESKYDAWITQLELATAEVTAHVPPEDSFVLVDEDQWSTGGEVAGRRAIPFLEQNGEYWGPPPDDETAIREFERLRQSGASFIVFAWPAFWWLEYYDEFHQYLRSNFNCVLENETLVAFDLRS